MMWFGFEAGASLGEEAIDEHGLVLNALEPPPDDRGQLIDGADGGVVHGVLHVRLRHLRRYPGSGV